MHPLVKKMIQGDKRALARLMTYVDNRHEDLMLFMKDVYAQTKGAFKIGITGPPGAGKSTLVDKLIQVYRQSGAKVGVVAIDPSSPFSGGAVLGDRIRMMDHGTDENVFIRSLGSRGSHGGLSRATMDIVHTMDAFGYDLILIETVGVGQTELDIMSVADLTVVVLVPESGDTIQTMKAGLMEIADVFVVNKADRDGADRIYAELKNLSNLFSCDKEVPVLKVEAQRAKGVDELVSVLKAEKSIRDQKVEDPEKRKIYLEQQCLEILMGELRKMIVNRLESDVSFQCIQQELIKNHRNPYLAAQELFEKFKY